MAKAKTAAAKPEAGDYLENGEKLVAVLGYTSEGDLIVEDAMTGDAETVKADAEGWRKVDRRKRG